MVVGQGLNDLIDDQCRVLDDPDLLEAYSEDKSFAPGMRPQCVVKAGTTEEVHRIVKWANSTRTPLVPISSGPPHFRGDTLPSVEGAVIVDLSEMKRIIRVDRQNRVAMIEPGVTFGELIVTLGKEGMAPFMPLSPRNTKSVVASCLEREPITIPRYHLETQDPLLCTEVIYGSGDYFRTGSAAGPGTIKEQWKVGKAQVRGMGPSQVDFSKLLQAAQGTMGIVTWATIRCKLLPKVKKTFLIPSDTIEGLIDVVYKLMWRRLGNDCIIVNAQNLACLLGTNRDDIISRRDILPPWVLIFSTEGAGLMPQEKVDGDEAEFMEIAKEYGLQPSGSLSEADSGEIVKILSGPSQDPYWKIRFKGGGHDIFFLTTLDKTPQFIKKSRELAVNCQYPEQDMGVYLQPTVQGTNCHCEFNLSYDPNSGEESERLNAYDRECSGSLADMGGFFSRPYGYWADIAFRRDPATVRTLRRLKNIFDPNAIMNPGKICFQGDGNGS